MSGYPGVESEARVPHAVLRDDVAKIFSGAGMEPADAMLLADSLAWADLRGVHSHGVLRVQEYVDKLKVGGVDPVGRPRLVRDSGAALVVDGGNSMGQVGSAFAMQSAIDRASAVNVAFAAVRGSNHCGAMGYFATLALERDMIGICGTNALPTMAPWGGIDKIVGINPVSIAIPTSSDIPFIYDAAFSASSHGKLRVYAQKGSPIPPTWAFDNRGQPTTSSKAALEGLLQPIGGFKGVALAMCTGMLSSLLSDAAYGTESGNMVDGARAGVDGHFFLAINVAGFTNPEHFKRRVSGIIDQVHECARAEGVDQLLVPGELEYETESRYRVEGIPLNQETLRSIAATATRLKVDVVGIALAIK